MRTLPIAVAALVLAAGARAQAPNFSNYVALGDSLTAGWQSGCLVDRHQLRSYPALLATQFGATVAQPGDFATTHFQQPLASEPGIPQPCTTISYNAQSGFVFDLHTGETGGAAENPFLPRPYNNLGIPGAEVGDLLNNIHSSGADIYSLVLRNFPGSPLDGTNAVEQAILQQPTFLTVWIGNNDILGAATSATVISGSCTALNNDASGACDGVTYTSVADFTQSYTTILQTLRGALPNTTIVVMNIPDVSSIPFTTTIPPVVFDPVTTQPILDPAGNMIPFIGQKHDGTVGPIPLDTLVTLGYGTVEAAYPGAGIPCPVYQEATQGRIDFCFGTEADGTTFNPQSVPLPDGGFVAGPGGQPTLQPGVLLYADEQAAISQRVGDFNAAIATAASAAGAKVFDVNSLFKDVRANGRTYAGVHIDTSFLSGGVFSYDGVHPSNIGYAMFDDEFIQYLNATYGTAIPRPNMLSILFAPDIAPSTTTELGRSVLARAADVPPEIFDGLVDLFSGERSYTLMPRARAASTTLTRENEKIHGR